MTDAEMANAEHLPSERFFRLLALTMGDAAAFKRIVDLAREQATQTGEPLPTEKEIELGVAIGMLLQVLDERLGRGAVRHVVSLGDVSEEAPTDEVMGASDLMPATAPGANGPAGPTGGSRP